MKIILITMLLSFQSAHASTALSELPLLRPLTGLKWGMDINAVTKIGKKSCKFLGATLAPINEDRAFKDDSAAFVCEDKKLYASGFYEVILNLKLKRLTSVTVLYPLDLTNLGTMFEAPKEGTFLTEQLARSATSQTRIDAPYEKIAKQDVTSKIKFIKPEEFENKTKSIFSVTPGTMADEFPAHFKEITANKPDSGALYEWVNVGTSTRGSTWYRHNGMGSYIMIGFSPDRI